MEKSKLKSVKYLGTTWEKDGNTFYNQEVEWENGDVGGASSKTEQAKWKVGEEYTYEKRVNGAYTNFFSIKPLNGFGNKGFRERPANEFALELSRKMYNSSQSTNNKWDDKQMLQIASWLLGELKKGFSRASIETSVTIENSFAANGGDIDTKRLLKNMKSVEQWLKENQ